MPHGKRLGRAYLNTSKCFTIESDGTRRWGTRAPRRTKRRQPAPLNLTHKGNLRSCLRLRQSSVATHRERPTTGSDEGNSPLACTNADKDYPIKTTRTQRLQNLGKFINAWGATTCF